MESVSVHCMERFSITGVETLCGDEGQSLMELLLMLPVLLALVVLVIKIQTAIQISIVNQKYARGRTLFLAYNSPVYPAIAPLGTEQMIAKGYNRMVIGVSENARADEDGVGGYVPKAITETIARSASTSIGPGEDKAEPDRRSVVRIRTTVALCTPSWVVRAGGEYRSLAISQDSFGSDFQPAAYAYCRSPRDE